MTDDEFLSSNLDIPKLEAKPNTFSYVPTAFAMRNARLNSRAVTLAFDRVNASILDIVTDYRTGENDGRQMLLDSYQGPKKPFALHCFGLVALDKNHQFDCTCQTLVTNHATTASLVDLSDTHARQLAENDDSEYAAAFYYYCPSAPTKDFSQWQIHVTVFDVGGTYCSFLAEVRVPKQGHIKLLSCTALYDDPAITASMSWPHIFRSQHRMLDIAKDIPKHIRE